jgi:hypothetical protein
MLIPLTPMLPNQYIIAITKSGGSLWLMIHAVINQGGYLTSYVSEADLS